MNRAERAKLELQRQKVKLARRKREADALAAKEKEAENRQEALIDEGVEETFPASDPVSAKRIT